MKELLKNGFIKIFNNEPKHYFSCGGRFEILGNHTDHNHGKCLAGTCSLSIYASVNKEENNEIKVYSEGFGWSKVDLDNLAVKDSEKGTSAALIKGIVATLIENGYKVGGLNIYMISKVPGGAGVSSSAAFELLVSQIFNEVFNEGKIDRLLLCKASQNAERNYYGKMCGLLDQIGVGYGGSVYIDFKDINNPEVEPLPIDLGDDYHFLIVNSGGSHAGLDHLYKAIPDDMFSVAHMFNENFLNDVNEEEVIKNRENIIKTLGELPYLRVMHFYSENKRVEAARKAIKTKDIDKLMKLMDESRVSSTEQLQNMKVKDLEGSPLEACLFLKSIGKDSISVKINGGGFAGSVISLVKDDVYKDVIKAAKEKYGDSNVFEISVRPTGPEKY